MARHALLILRISKLAPIFVDLLLETRDGWIIVDHKATPRPRNECKEIAEGYSGQLAMYKSAVEAVSGRPVVGTWIHMPVGGREMPVNVQDKN